MFCEFAVRKFSRAICTLELLLVKLVHDKSVYLLTLVRCLTVRAADLPFLPVIHTLTTVKLITGTAL